MSGDDSPGWDAIDVALRSRYGDQKPRHVGYTPGLAFGSGLQGCSAYDAGDHWHYVSYGLTELYAKNPASDPDVSGWGYELTVRVSRAGLPEPPGWPFGLLEQIARFTRENSHVFCVGDRLDLTQSITADPTSRLTAVVFMLDATLAPIGSVNGRFEFRQLVGVSGDELDEMKATSNDQVLDRLARNNPMLVTDASRSS